MEITLDANCRQPIAEQIVTQIKKLIAEGGLKAGEQLPAVRELADRLLISRMTTAKAYNILCGEGLIENAGTAGHFAVTAKENGVDR